MNLCTRISDEVRGRMGYSIYRILEDGPTKLLGGWLYSSFVYLAEVLRKFGIEIH